LSVADAINAGLGDGFASARRHTYPDGWRLDRHDHPGVSWHRNSGVMRW
jgi:hypothetical protein